MSILRLLASRPLPCGCQVGIYETYAGPIAWVLDVRGAGCTEPAHRPGQALSPQKPSAIRPEPNRTPARRAS